MNKTSETYGNSIKYIKYTYLKKFQKYKESESEQ